MRLLKIGLFILCICLLSSCSLSKTSHKNNLLYNYSFTNGHYDASWNSLHNNGKMGHNINSKHNVKNIKNGTEIIGDFNKHSHKYVAGTLQNPSVHIHPNEMISATIKTPSISRGVKTAFWLYNIHHQSNPVDTNEIDVYEDADNNLDSGLFVTGLKGNADNHKININSKHLHYQFHTYSVMYLPHKLIFYIDGHQTGQMSNNIPNDTYFPVFDMDIDIPHWTGKPDNKKLPVDMIVKNINITKV